jgi:hypothetical protein
MSQVSQEQDANWASIPVAKFSHSTLPIGAQNITWTHLNNRNDIDLVIRSTQVFDGARNPLPQTVMKITVGAEVLVRILSGFRCLAANFLPRKSRT